MTRRAALLSLALGLAVSMLSPHPYDSIALYLGFALAALCEALRIALRLMGRSPGLDVGEGRGAHAPIGATGPVMPALPWQETGNGPSSAHP